MDTLGNKAIDGLYCTNNNPNYSTIYCKFDHTDYGFLKYKAL